MATSSTHKHTHKSDEADSTFGCEIKTTISFDVGGFSISDSKVVEAFISLFSFFVYRCGRRSTVRDRRRRATRACGVTDWPLVVAAIGPAFDTAHSPHRLVGGAWLRGSRPMAGLRPVGRHWPPPSRPRPPPSPYRVLPSFSLFFCLLSFFFGFLSTCNLLQMRLLSKLCLPASCDSIRLFFFEVHA